MIDRILELMSEKGLNGSDLSKAVGINHGAISDWKKGKGKPTAEAIIKIANYFGVSTDYLLLGVDVSNVTSDIYSTALNAILSAQKQKGLSNAEFEAQLNLPSGKVDEWKNCESNLFIEKLEESILMLDTFISISLPNNPIPSTKMDILHPDDGSAEWFRRGLIARGVIKEGEDISEELFDVAMANLETIVKIVNKKKDNK